MGRRGKRSNRKPFAVYVSESEARCRVVDHVSLEEGLEQERLGVVERAYDTVSGELIGFRRRARVQDDSALPSQPTPAAIGAPTRKRPTDPQHVSEMEIFAFAGTTFLDANSHTAGRREEDRLAREKSGREPEDKIEKTIGKVLMWRFGMTGARRDVLRVWPRGQSLVSLQRSSQ